MSRGLPQRRVCGWCLGTAMLVFAVCCGVGRESSATDAPPGPAAGSEARHPAASAEESTRRGSSRRAVVVGIDDYSASSLSPPARSSGAAPGRQWRSLLGSVNDARAIREMLIARYGFAPDQVRLLVDQEGTRERILAAVEQHLVDPAGPGDHLVFFYAGHGSQVVNSKSEEPDGKDESLVPADSRLGAPDIRDKELRRLFNRALDRGARLTVILDSCHSGSGARGVPHERRARGLRFDPRDVADGSNLGLALEDRDAVVLSAAQDFEQALEDWDPEHERYHGAYTLALLRAVRSTALGESAEAVCQSARAWLHGPGGMIQEPVCAGRPQALARPLLGEEATGSGGSRPLAAVEAVNEGGGIVLQAGWIHGLAVGSELEAAGDGSRQGTRRLRVTALQGLTHSRAEVVATVRREGASPEPSVRPGELFALAGWAVPPGPPLQVWAPTADEATRRWASQVSEVAVAAGVGVTLDPTVGEPPSHVLSWRRDGWRLTGEDRVERLGEMEPAAVVERLRRSHARPRLFVEFPAPPELVARVETATRQRKVELVDDPARAEYFLVGRSREDGLELAWMLPGTMAEHQDLSPLPLRSDWHRLDAYEPLDMAAVAERLAADAQGLARLQAWLRLAEESPPARAFPYTLALRAASPEKTLVTGGELVEGDHYGLLLRSELDRTARPIVPRYIYAFVVDSFGRCVPLYPEYGNVENFFPLEDGPPYATEIPLGPQPGFEISQPYGVDSYYLLSTREPLQDPRVLECRGVRTRRSESYKSALEELLARTGSTTRGAETLLTPETWSLQRLTFHSGPAN